MTSLTPTDTREWTAVRISTRWGHVRRGLEARRDLKVAEGRLLWLLRDGQPRTLKQIADELDLDQSTVNRQVNGALESGLLTRTRDPETAAYLVQASADGRSRFQADIDRQVDIHTRALAAVPEPDQAAFLDQLGRYVEALATASSDDGQDPPAQT